MNKTTKIARGIIGLLGCYSAGIVISSDYSIQLGKAADIPGAGKKIEYLRTVSILQRFAPKPPAILYDIGGGSGTYAIPLAQQGYKVHLIDLTNAYLTKARQKMKRFHIMLEECSEGDAREIQAADEVADVVLLLGPLYHLQNKTDRAKALREAYRILRPGGIIFAAALSRLLLGFQLSNKHMLTEPKVAALVEDVISCGKNKNPLLGSTFFNTAYFHHPDEFEQELWDAKFKDVSLFSVEGASGLNSSLSAVVADKRALDHLLDYIRQTETDRTIIGISAHMLAVGHK